MLMQVLKAEQAFSSKTGKPYYKILALSENQFSYYGELEDIPAPGSICAAEFGYKGHIDKFYDIGDLNLSKFKLKSLKNSRKEQF